METLDRGRSRVMKKRSSSFHASFTWSLHYA